MKWRVIFLSLLLSFTQLAIAQGPEVISLYTTDSLWSLKKKINLSNSPSVPKAYHGLIPFKLIDTAAGLVVPKYGFINTKGEPVIQACYDTLVSNFEKGYAIVGRYETYNRSGVRRRRMRTRMVYGVLLPANKLAVPLQYYSVSSLPEHLFLVQNFKRKIGVRNLNKEIIPCRYDFIDMPDSNYVFAELDGEYTVFNMKGELLFEGLKEVERINADSLMLHYYHRYSILNRNGKQIGTLCGDSLSSCKPFSLQVFRNGITYQTDTSGNVTLRQTTGMPCASLHYAPPLEISAFDSLGINTDTTRFPFIKKYKRVWEFRDNYAKVEDLGKYGFIDTMGNVKISIQYPKATYFQEGFVQVVLKGKWAVMDKEENIIAQPYYQYISPYRNGCAIARTGKKHYLLNRLGKEINKTPYDSIATSSFYQWQVWLKGVSGLTDSTGHELLAPRYSCIIPTPIHRYIACKDGKFGVVDEHENIIIPFAYESIVYDEHNQLFLIYLHSERIEFSSRSGTHHLSTP